MAVVAGGYGSGASGSSSAPPPSPTPVSYEDLTDTPTLGTAASKNVGTEAGEVVSGGDARLSDARTPTLHGHTAAQVTGLHTVATTGDYQSLSNRPTIPAAVNARSAIIATGALTANVVKSITVTWGSVMPSATYAVTATVEHATAPQQFTTSLVSRTAAGCVVAVRSTAAVAGGVNLNVIAVA